MTITYWKNNSTGAIYKYFGDSKPLNTDRYTQVAAADYDNAIAHAINARA